MSTESDRCLLCYQEMRYPNSRSKKSTIQRDDIRPKCPSGPNIDLLQLCDILRVSVNEAEKYVGRSISLCKTCDEDIRNLKILLHEIKIMKINLSSLMHHIKIKISESFSDTKPEEYQNQLNLLRNEILFDLNTVLGFSKPKEAYSIKIEQPDISLNSENNYYDNIRSQSPEIDKFDLVPNSLPQIKENFEPLIQTSRFRKATTAKAHKAFEKDERVTGDNDQKHHSENVEFSPDLCANMSSDTEESENDYFPTENRKTSTKILYPQKELKEMDKSLQILVPGPVLSIPGESKIESGSENVSGSSQPISIGKGVIPKRKGKPRSENSSYCVICERELPSPSFLEKHLRDVHGVNGTSGTWKCNLCGRVYKNKKRFDDHVKRHSEGFIPHVCSICGKHYQTRRSLHCHEKLHGLEANVSCDICEKKFKTKYRLQCHMESHLTGPKYTCDQCGKAFKYTSHFQTHIRMHKRIAESGVKTFDCDICGRTLTTLLSLQSHKKVYHPKTTIIHQCNICGRILTRADHLKNHKKIHQIPTETAS